MRYLSLNVGASAPNPDARDFSRKVPWNFKSFAKIKWCSWWEILLFTFLIRKVREGGLERSSNILQQIKSTATPCFLRALSVGAIRPKPGHKGLFGKSPLESQKFRKNKVVFGVRSSPLHLSPKERYVLLLTFLIRKVREE